MISDTQISDSTPHNPADLGMLCRKFERELNAAKQRIRRLEELGDEAIYPFEYAARVRIWTEAKEAKP
jgi:hypothetical protein